MREQFLPQRLRPTVCLGKRARLDAVVGRDSLVAVGPAVGRPGNGNGGAPPRSAHTVRMSDANVRKSSSPCFLHQHQVCEVSHARVLAVVELLEHAVKLLSRVAVDVNDVDLDRPGRQRNRACWEARASRSLSARAPVVRCRAVAVRTACPPAWPRAVRAR